MSNKPETTPPNTKECFKIISRWLARNYDKKVELAMFNIQHELDCVTAQLEAELKWRRDNDND